MVDRIRCEVQLLDKVKAQARQALPDAALPLGELAGPLNCQFMGMKYIVLDDVAGLGPQASSLADTEEIVGASPQKEGWL